MTDTMDAERIVASLDLSTKISLLSGVGHWWLEALPDHQLDAIQLSDGPHGLRQQAGPSDHLGLRAAVPATCFPTATTLGSSWDVELVEAVGAAIAEEALAQGVAVILGPGLNIKRHPAGGRCFEYLSEDPLISGKLAAAFVRGAQGIGVGTSIKHFAVNNQEAYRFVVDALVDERTLREIYLRGFEIAVKESAPWTLMCSYNRVNGTQASEHHELLTSILRDEWGFDGLVVSDWGAVNDRVAGIRAGLDLEMPSSQGAFDEEIAAAVSEGRLAVADIDRCATRVVELLQRGQRRTGDHPANHEAHHQLARRAAAAGTVLLANDGVLPLAPTGHIAVLGAFAQHPRYQGAGSSQVTPTQLDNALDAMRLRVGDAAEVTYLPSYDVNTGETTHEQIDAAVRAATIADVAVLFVGLPAPSESEGFDRSNLDLPDGHIRLIEAVAATATPVVVVLSNGGTVHMAWADRVEAVVDCWLGGQASGSAAVDVLFGDVEPGGRLAESVPEHVAQLPADRFFPGGPRQVQHREGPFIGYRFHDTAAVPARFAFGHGLSYTTFEWSEVKLADEGPNPSVHVTVTNSGDRRGTDVVQIYVRRLDSALSRPDKELVAFAKVSLEPGESAALVIDLEPRAFENWDIGTHDWATEGGDVEILVARSSVDVAATLHHHVDASGELAPGVRPEGLVASDAEFEAMLGRPIPETPPRLPFHRNSTLEDIATTPVGRAVAATIVRIGLKEAEKEFPNPDPATIRMVRTAINEGPARSLVQMGGGRISFRALDKALAALNRISR